MQIGMLCMYVFICIYLNLCLHICYISVGMWARQLGQSCGVNIPNQAAEHYYLITDTMPEVDPNWPVIEDPSSYTYIRPEVYHYIMILRYY